MWYIFIPVGAAVLAALLLWLHWGNNNIMITPYTFNSPNVPEAFNGFRILQISDLHNKNYRPDYFFKKVRACKPDIIIITGDIINSRRPNIDRACAFAKKLARIAPSYYVTGNHEERSACCAALLKKLKTTGVRLLENSCETLSRSGGKVALCGLWEIDVQKKQPFDKVEHALAGLRSDAEGRFRLLLAHRPERISLYADAEMDLVFSGHAHGGQVRLPFIGGLFAPAQGLFPKYTKGFYQEKGTTMVVSRGLGDSRIPARIFNRPELVVVTLKHKALD